MGGVPRRTFAAQQNGPSEALRLRIEKAAEKMGLDPPEKFIIDRVECEKIPGKEMAEGA